MTLRLIYWTLFAVFITLPGCSLLKKPKEKVANVEQKEVNLVFQVDGKSFDLKEIKAKCAIIDSTQGKVPDEFSFIDFFHIYLKFISYRNDYSKYFECRNKLEVMGAYLLALDREPLPKIDFASDVDTYTIHREIIRNLYKSVVVVKNPKGEYIEVHGISVAQGKFFSSTNKDLLDEVTNPKSYFKFYSYLDEKSGNYQEFFIPIQSYKLIKEYLLKINSLEKATDHRFGMSYSAMIYLLSLEIEGKTNFTWIDEISTTPYYSVVHPLNRFMLQDKTLDNTSLVLGYSFNFRLFNTSVLLANLIKQTAILPKNFSVLPIIEKSFKSGSREYCGTIRNATDLLVIEKLYNNRLVVSKSYMKHCIRPAQSADPKIIKVDPNATGEFRL